MIKIIPAIPEHSESLSEFATRTFYQAYGWYNTPENMKKYVDHHFSEEQLKTEISEGKSNYFIAFENEKITGYVKTGKGNRHPDLKPDLQLEIERIYVDKASYRKGIGYQLLQKTIGFANENKIKVIWLGVWKKNKIAIAFYTRNNFEIFGTTQFLLGDDLQDDFLMKREL